MNPNPDRPTPENRHGLFKRIWPILSILVIALLLQFSQVLLGAFGAQIYIPILVTISIAFAMLIRRIINKTTTEEDSANGTFDRNWDNLDPTIKCIIQKVEVWWYFYVCAQIACACIK